MEEFKVLEEFLSALEKEYSNRFLLLGNEVTKEEVIELRTQLQVVKMILNLPVALEEAKKRIEKAKELQDKMKKQNQEVL